MQQVRIGRSPHLGRQIAIVFSLATLGFCNKDAVTMSRAQDAPPGLSINDERGADRPWGEAVHGVRASLMASKDGFAVGEPILLTYLLGNESKVDVSMVSSHFLNDYEFDAAALNTGILSLEPAEPRDFQKRRPLPKTLFGKNLDMQRLIVGARSIKSIEPAEQLQTEFHRVPLNRLFDMSLAAEYEVRVSRKVYAKDLKSSWTVTSNTLSIKVVAEKRPARGKSVEPN